MQIAVMRQLNRSVRYVSRQVHEVKVSGMRRHKLEIQSTDNSNPNTDNFRLIVVRRTPSHMCASSVFEVNCSDSLFFGSFRQTLLASECLQSTMCRTEAASTAS